MSQCPLKMSDVASLPHSLYNFSYYPLFPGPFCKGCGHATVNGKCVDVFNDRQKVMTRFCSNKLILWATEYPE